MEQSAARLLDQIADIHDMQKVLVAELEPGTTGHSLASLCLSRIGRAVNDADNLLEEILVARSRSDE